MLHTVCGHLEFGPVPPADVIAGIPGIPAGRGVWGHGPEVVYGCQCMLGMIGCPGDAVCQGIPSGMPRNAQWGFGCGIPIAALIFATFLITAVRLHCFCCASHSRNPGIRKTKDYFDQGFTGILPISQENPRTSNGIPSTPSSSLQTACWEYHGKDPVRRQYSLQRIPKSPLH